MTFRFPPLDEQSALAVKGVVYKARTLRDLRVFDLTYVELVARCALHGEFSVVYAEDEITHLEAGDNLAPRLPCPSCDSLPPANSHTASHFRMVRNPWLAPRGE